MVEGGVCANIERNPRGGRGFSAVSEFAHASRGPGRDPGRRRDGRSGTGKHRPCSTGEREPTNHTARRPAGLAAPPAQLAEGLSPEGAPPSGAPFAFRRTSAVPPPYSPEARAWLLGDASRPGRGHHAGMSSVSVRSGDAVFSFGDDLRVLTWNAAAERLTGIPAEEAIGEPCWSVLGARSPRGDLLCHSGCSNARLAREGWCVDCQAMAVRDAAGELRHVETSTIRVEQDGRRVYLHVLRESPGPADVEPAPTTEPVERAPELTARQLEILRLVDGGRGARAIAAELRLAESTVRNHIRGILVAFGAHSQLEALAQARRCGLLRPS